MSNVQRALYCLNIWQLFDFGEPKRDIRSNKNFNDIPKIPLFQAKQLDVPQKK